jgi:hypothetical protein
MNPDGTRPIEIRSIMQKWRARSAQNAKHNIQFLSKIQLLMAVQKLTAGKLLDLLLLALLDENRREITREQANGAQLAPGDVDITEAEYGRLRLSLFSLPAFLKGGLHSKRRPLAGARQSNPEAAV